MQQITLRSASLSHFLSTSVSVCLCLFVQISLSPFRSVTLPVCLYHTLAPTLPFSLLFLPLSLSPPRFHPFSLVPSPVLFVFIRFLPLPVSTPLLVSHSLLITRILAHKLSSPPLSLFRFTFACAVTVTVIQDIPRLRRPSCQSPSPADPCKISLSTLGSSPFLLLTLLSVLTAV